MASMYCPKCNTPIDPRSTFCGSCGYALQTTGAATSPSSPEQQKGAFPSSTFPMAGSPPPPPYSLGNTPSSATFPAAGSPPPPPPFPVGNMPSSPSYPGAGLPPPYPSGNMSSSPSYPGAGSPPPYPGGSTPSSPTYQTNVPGFPPAYPKSEPNLPPQQPQLPQPRKRRNKGGVIFAVIVAIILIGAALAGAYVYTSRNPSLSKTNTSPTQGTTATTAPTSNSTTPTQSTTATATTDTATATATLTSGSTTPTQSTTATTVTGTTNSYSATQPGPGCDSNGGTWTPQGISNITCGTQISVSSGNARGYLSLQLPNSQAFSSNNSIGITGTLTGSNDCVGLAEQDANTGYLVEYCNDGKWYIYSISSTGAIVKTLAQSITSTRTNEQLSLTIKGTTLSFSIDTEVHKINISAIQPTKVAVTYVTPYYYGGRVTITNFSYTTQ